MNIIDMEFGQRGSSLRPEWKKPVGRGKKFGKIAELDGGQKESGLHEARVTSAVRNQIKA